jgi:3-isopropylmalate/(R)-2-methylmalate dehydratase large subunit
MGMTVSEKILAAHAGLDEVRPGQLVTARGGPGPGFRDPTAPLAIEQFQKAGASHRVFDRDKVVMVPDHFAPNKDVVSAGKCKLLREFSAEACSSPTTTSWAKWASSMCSCPSKGLVAPGELIIGADSHTCTYGALGAFATGVGSTDLAAVMISGELWFKVPLQHQAGLHRAACLQMGGRQGPDPGDHRRDRGGRGPVHGHGVYSGEAIEELGMDGRFTMANMAVEAGAKNGIFQGGSARPWITWRAGWTGSTRYMKSDGDATSMPRLSRSR